MKGTDRSLSAVRTVQRGYLGIRFELSNDLGYIWQDERVSSTCRNEGKETTLFRSMYQLRCKRR